MTERTAELPESPPRWPEDTRAATIGRFRVGIDSAIGRIRARSKYLTDKQRAELRELAAGKEEAASA